MSQYQATLPSDNSVKPETAKYFETFYKISDTPDAHDRYTEQFTKDATLIMATSVSKGSDGMCPFNQKKKLPATG